MLFNDLKAMSFITFDARSMAMGGAGVAESNSESAALFNPALMLTKESNQTDDFFTNLYIGARLIDRDNFIERVRTLEDEGFEELIDNSLADIKTQFNGGVLSSADLRTLSENSMRILNDVGGIANRPLRASASIGFSADRVAEKYAYGIYYRNYFVIGAEVNLAEIDTERLQHLINASSALADVIDDSEKIAELIATLDLEIIETLAQQSVLEQRVVPELLNYADIPGVDAIIQAIRTAQPNIAALLSFLSVADLQAALMAQNAGGDLSSLGLSNVDLRNYLRYQIPEKFESTVDYSGAQVNELALSVATNNFWGEKIRLGLNFKKVDIDLIEFSQTFDDIDFGAYKLKSNREYYSRFNMDIGSVYQINKYYAVGIVVRNVIPYTLLTASGKPIKFDPVARIGMGYESKSMKVALDFDLTRNEPLGFDPDKKYLSAGIEWNVGKLNVLRAGYRFNTIDQSGLPSLGFALGFNQGHVDVALTRSGKEDEYGLSLQAGFKF